MSDKPTVRQMRPRRVRRVAEKEVLFRFFVYCLWCLKNLMETFNNVFKDHLNQEVSDIDDFEPKLCAQINSAPEPWRHQAREYNGGAAWACRIRPQWSADIFDDAKYRVILKQLKRCKHESGKLLKLALLPEEKTFVDNILKAINEYAEDTVSSDSAASTFTSSPLTESPEPLEEEASSKEDNGEASTKEHKEEASSKEGKREASSKEDEDVPSTSKKAKKK